MATTGVVNSKLMSIRTGGSPTVITCQTNANLKFTNGTRQTTCKDSGQWEEYLYAMSSWTMSGEALFSYDATNGGTALYTIASGQTTVSVTYGTGVSGDYKWTGTALVTEWALDSPTQNENVVVSYTFQGTGALTMSS